MRTGDVDPAPKVCRQGDNISRVTALNSYKRRLAPLGCVTVTTNSQGDARSVMNKRSAVTRGWLRIELTSRPPRWSSGQRNQELQKKRRQSDTTTA